MKNSFSPISWRLFALPIAGLLCSAACSTVTPVELINARTAYDRASTGPAAEVAPADLHKAKTALDIAERNFAEEEDTQKTVDLAYIAERTAQIAEARAQIILSSKEQQAASREYADTQEALATETRGDLAATRAKLNESQRGQADQAALTADERAKRQEAEKNAAASESKAADAESKAADAELRANEANEALAKLAAKEDERGTVITLSGSVLFRSNESALLPAAQVRLDEVAAALVTKGNDVVVEGFTDSRGSRATNMSLSQRRAESVLTYLVSRGFPMSKILARGIGPDRPIADNANAEGRANNRRVEIVIARTANKVN